MNLIGQSLSICIKKATDYLNIPCRYTSFYHKQDLNTIPFNIGNGPVILSFEGIEYFIISYVLACPIIYANMIPYCQETNLTLEHVGYDKIEKKIYDICLNEHDTVNENATLLPRGIIEEHVQKFLVDCKFEEFLEYTINYVFNTLGKVPLFHLPSVPVANFYNIKTENKKALSLKVQDIVDDIKRNIFEKFGGIYLNRPENTTDEFGFLKHEYRADSVHGNVQYGIVQINQMKSLGII